jgi:DNA-binding phage protein
VLISAVPHRFSLLDPFLTEQTRRVWVAAEASILGLDGTTIVAEAAGLSRTTIIKALYELDD